MWISRVDAEDGCISVVAVATEAAKITSGGDTREVQAQR